MNKPSPASLAPLAALLLAGSALAQTIPAPNPSGVDPDRVNRRCTTATLSTDATAPCPDDVLIDRQGPVVVRPPAAGAVGSGSAGSTGTPAGSIPSGGTLNAGPSSSPGATAPGTASPTVRTTPATR